LSCQEDEAKERARKLATDALVELWERPRRIELFSEAVRIRPERSRSIFAAGTRMRIAGSVDQSRLGGFVARRSPLSDEGAKC
jgi:hypothetical protein